jgi:hypothetical protein
VFVDRSSEDFAAYLLLGHILKSRGARIINDPESYALFSSKADLYELLKRRKLPLPKTCVLHPRERSQNLFRRIIKTLGVPFVLNPSYGGAGEGVLLNASNEQNITEYLERNNVDHSIAHEYIIPATKLGRYAWFRPIYVCGEVYSLWWDQQNHYYQEFGVTSFEKKTSHVLQRYAKIIARLTKLDLFSFEVVLDERGKYLIVDYTNHPIDLNTQDNIADGLPPRILKNIIVELVKSIKIDTAL